MELTRRDSLTVFGIATGAALAGCLSSDDGDDRTNRYTTVGPGGTPTPSSSFAILNVRDVEADDGTLHVEFQVRNDGTERETGLLTLTVITASGSVDREDSLTLDAGEQVTHTIEFDVQYGEFRSLQQVGVQRVD